ncbi:hypothetical protein GOBAR_AA06679 [Gossypium barbadense]|uniref:Uncharacterized protein n=1 Tax=Gossypium barbadense TaxID=3634 RepID=A0A2P5YE68_GOSBA|nr:hypothetical protein GOBAR_AA06679 [Gossypium barbadense]
MQETISKNTYEPCSNNNKGPIYEELRTPDKPKLSQDKLKTLPNQLKVGDKVLLDATDPRIATLEPNEEIPLTVLSIFPYGTVEVIHPKFDTFKGKIFSPTRDAISYHGHVTWLWVKLPKQYGCETRPCFKTVVEIKNVTRAYDTPVPSTRGLYCQNKHGRGPMFTGVGEVKEVRYGRETRPCSPTRPKNTGVGQMSDAPKFKIRETHGQKLGHTGVSRGRVPQNLYKPLTIHHLPPQKTLTLAAATSHTLPLTPVQCRPHMVRRPLFSPRRRGKEQRHPRVLPRRLGTRSSRFPWDLKRNYIRYYGHDP